MISVVVNIQSYNKKNTLRDHIYSPIFLYDEEKISATKITNFILLFYHHFSNNKKILQFIFIFISEVFFCPYKYHNNCNETPSPFFAHTSSSWSLWAFTLSLSRSFRSHHHHYFHSHQSSLNLAVLIIHRKI
jgi:hypothetical protein